MSCHQFHYQKLHTMNVLPETVQRVQHHNPDAVLLPIGPDQGGCY